MPHRAKHNQPKSKKVLNSQFTHKVHTTLYLQKKRWLLPRTCFQIKYRLRDLSLGYGDVVWDAKDESFHSCIFCFPWPKYASLAVGPLHKWPNDCNDIRVRLASLRFGKSMVKHPSSFRSQYCREPSPHFCFCATQTCPKVFLLHQVWCQPRAPQPAASSTSCS